MEQTQPQPQPRNPFGPAVVLIPIVHDRGTVDSRDTDPVSGLPAGGWAAIGPFPDMPAAWFFLEWYREFLPDGCRAVSLRWPEKAVQEMLDGGEI